MFSHNTQLENTCQSPLPFPLRVVLGKRKASRSQQRSNAAREPRKSMLLFHREQPKCVFDLVIATNRIIASMSMLLLHREQPKQEIKR